MLAGAVAAFFRYKVVGSVIILACWPTTDRLKLLRSLSENGVRASFSCDLSSLNITNRHGLHGVLYFSDTKSDLLITKVKREHFSTWYKWLVVSESLPEVLNGVRYDADIAYLNLNYTRLYFFDVYVHPMENASMYPWANWNKDMGMQLTHENERQRRRSNLKGYPLKIATPNGLYSPEQYSGTFSDYVTDDTRPEVDSTTRCGYAMASLITESLNATSLLVHTLLWNSDTDNRSMLVMVSAGEADLSGTILRPRHERITRLDYFTAIWPFSVGFTYIAERESSSNMYVEPFSEGVWLSFLGTGVLLAVALRVTARLPDERRDAVHSAVASCLQQDTATVPEGGSGRTVFMTLSVCSMLVHAYYTSAVVSALMHSGRGGPETIRALADSGYSIAAEDYDYVRYSFFGAESNWTDMEYLKVKKMTSRLYQPIKKGVKMLASGNTAYHTEYNSLYPLLKVLSDDQLCKLQYIDTIPETMTYIVGTKWSQYANIASSKGAWLHETGLADRTLRRWRNQPPPCRAALLAERVKFGDVVPLITVSILGALSSVLVLAIEFIVAKFNRRNANGSNARDYY